MDATLIQILGYTGSFLSSITFIPQVIQVYKTKSTKDLSTNMLSIVVLSTIIWIFYGIGLKAWPVILCNTIIFILSSWLIYFKLSNEKKH